MLQPTHCVNQIEGVCRDIERTINQTVQNTLSILERHCETLTVKIEKRLERDSEDRGFNFKTWCRGIIIWFCSLKLL